MDDGREHGDKWEFRKERWCCAGESGWSRSMGCGTLASLAWVRSGSHTVTPAQKIKLERVTDGQMRVSDREGKGLR